MPLTREEIYNKWNEASRLANEGCYPEALERYLFVFHHSRDVIGLGGVRGSYLLEEVIRVGENYPPARQALIECRDNFAKELLQGRGGYDEMNDLVSLNRYLKNEVHSLELYDQLQTHHNPSVDFLCDMAGRLWKQLAQAQRYNDLSQPILTKVKKVMDQMAEYQISQDLASEILPEPVKQEYLLHSVTADGPLVYEVLLALGKESLAAILAERLSAFDPSDSMQATLREHAERAKR